MIEVNNISKTFGEKRVLKDVSFTIEQSKTNLIIGESGMGKSVFLKSVVGLHPVDNGNILYDGRDLTQMNDKELKTLRREIGMVFQGGALFNSSSVEENIRFPLDMFTKMSKKEKQKELIFEEMTTEHSIRCSNCRNIDKTYNCDEDYASEYFYNKGWRIKFNNYCYCPKCAEVNNA